jgi:hypothetical protein
MKVSIFSVRVPWNRYWQALKYPALVLIRYGLYQRRFLSVVSMFLRLLFVRGQNQCPRKFHQHFEAIAPHTESDQWVMRCIAWGNRGGQEDFYKTWLAGRLTYKIDRNWLPSLGFFEGFPMKIMLVASIFLTGVYVGLHTDPDGRFAQVVGRIHALVTSQIE